MKQTPGDIIILHMCIKNYDQMIIIKKSKFIIIIKTHNQNLKNMKKTWIYHHFTRVYQKS